MQSEERMCTNVTRNYFSNDIYTVIVVICSKTGCLALYFNISKVVDDRLWLNREDIKQSGSHKIEKNKS